MIEQDIEYFQKKLSAALAIPEGFLKPQGSALSVEIQAGLTEHAVDQWFLEWLEAYRQAGVERTAKGFALLNEANKIYQQTRLKLDMMKMNDMELDMEHFQQKLLASFVGSLATPKEYLNWSGNWPGSSHLIAAQTRQVAASLDKAILNMLLGNTTSEANEIYQSA